MIVVHNNDDIWDAIINGKERCVLATIIHVDGSAYRKEGVNMLFLENGQQIGMISAGCLETDLAIQAKQLFDHETAYSRTVRYDMRSEDDLSWGRGAGCSGIIHILLEKIHSQLKRELTTAYTYLCADTPLFACTFLRKDNEKLRTDFITMDNRPLVGEPIIHFQPLIDIALKTNQAKIHSFNNDKVFIQPLHPKPRLFIFGAGPDSRPLASLADQIGFSVFIWDWRPTYLQNEYFPQATLLKDPSLSETCKASHFRTSDSVIVMTHDFQKDKEIIQLLPLYEHIHYLGILGPRKRTKRLFQGKNIPTEIHSPIGLSIGADGPMEISISIIAELIATQHKGPPTKKMHMASKMLR